MKHELLLVPATLLAVSLQVHSQQIQPSPGAVPPGAHVVFAGPGACAIPPGTPGVMTVSHPAQVRPNEIKFVDRVMGPQRSLWNRPGMGPKIVPSIACYGGRPVSPDGQDVSRIPAGAECQMLTGNPAPGGGGAVKVISCWPAAHRSAPPPGAVPPDAHGFAGPGACAIPPGTPGVMTVSHPAQVRPNEIKFVDRVMGPQRSLWNRPGMGPKIVPSIACYGGRPVSPDGQDVSRIPAGAECQMLTGNPAPGGGGAVKVISCNAGGAAHPSQPNAVPVLPQSGGAPVSPPPGAVPPGAPEGDTAFRKPPAGVPNP